MAAQTSSRQGAWRPAQDADRVAPERLVRFWDSSALIPLFVVEPSSALVRRWLEEDADVVVWALTRVELLSAIARRRRARRDLAAGLANVRRSALAASEHWLE